MAIQTFGVVAADVAAIIGDIMPSGVDAYGKPTTTNVGTFIDRAAARVAGAVRAAGGSPAAVAASTASEAYANLAALVALGAARDTLQARVGSEDPAVAELTRRFDQELTILSNDPQQILADLYSTDTNGGVATSHIEEAHFTDTTADESQSAAPTFRVSDEL